MKQLQIRNSEEKYYTEKIVCVGRNYSEHAAELGNVVPDSPLLFLKPASAMIHSGENVIHPPYSENLHYEVELVLLIGKNIKDANDQQAEDAIAGYAVGLDMTLRDIQTEEIKKAQPWTISKGFDTSAVLSDFILKKDHELTMNEVISLKVNGEVKQNCPLNKMIFQPIELVKYISSRLKLEKGDLIFTGTPSGVGRVVKGDKLEGEISEVAKVNTEIV